MPAWQTAFLWSAYVRHPTLALGHRFPRGFGLGPARAGAFEKCATRLSFTPDPRRDMAAAMKLAWRRWGILWFTLLTLLGLGGCAGAQSAAPASPPPQSAEAKLAEPPAKHSRGIFYEVRGAEATVFLL